jgi:C1A family cysteine protease
MRFNNFKTKHIAIEAHNNSDHKFKLGHNRMSDWTEEEYKAILTFRPGLENAAVPSSEIAGEATPIDWRQSGCIPPVQDQGQCGSCWAFSAVTAVESDYCIDHGTLYSLSPQQLIDCVKLCSGCNGGSQALAFNYYESHYAELLSTYPYTARDGVCKYAQDIATVVKTTSWVSVTPDSPDAMKAALASYPLAVAIEANTIAFQMYAGGVFTNTNCGTQLDHATNVVGWGTTGTMDYWIMRNSWGTSWGMGGNMEIEIVDGPGICGIQMQPLYPITN